MERFHHREKNVSGQSGGQTDLKTEHERRKREKEREKGKMKGKKKRENSKPDFYTLLPNSFSCSPGHAFQTQAGDQVLLK